MTTITDRAWEVQKKVEQRFQRMGKGKYGRVIKMARNPDTDEFAKTSQMTIIGIFIIGIIGFAILMVATEVAPWVGEQLGL
jgi:protein transport protein SEC61 subunit gamma-like protein